MNELSMMGIGLVMGAVIGLNGTFIGAYTALLTTKFGNQKSLNHITGIGFVVLFYLVMLLLIGSLLLALCIETLAGHYQQALLVATPVVAVTYGCILVRRYFWHASVAASSSHHKKTVHRHATKYNGVLQPLVVAATMLYAISPLLVTAMLLLSLISITLDILPFFWSAFFTLGIITPLYIVLALLVTGTKASHIITWKNHTKATMYLYSGFSIIILAWITLYAVITHGAFV